MRPLWLPLAVALAALPAQASAIGVAVGKDGETVRLSNVRLAVATTASRTACWAQIAITGASAGFAWLVPVRPGARLDLASDAWLDALDAATVPLVVSPTTTPSCANTVGGVDRIVPVMSPASTLPSHAAVLFDVASVSAFVAAAGYALPPSLDGPLTSVFGNGEAVAVLVYDTSTLPVRTLRVVDDGPADLPLALSGNPAANVPVTAFVVGAAAENAGDSPLHLDPSLLVWTDDGHSNYTHLLTSVIAAWRGARWLTESATLGVLFDGIRAGDATASPALIDEYFALAVAYGDATGDPAACAAAARGTASDPSPYVALCPAGSLAVVPGAMPCGPPGADGTPIDPLTCGGTADDAALGVAGLAPSEIWVSRTDGIVTAASAGEVSLTAAGSSAASAVSAVVTAGKYASTCPTPSPSSGPAASPAPAASPSTNPDPSTSSADTAAAAGDACGSTLGSSCSGDSSSSSEDSGGCSSGSSGSEDGSGGCSSSSGSGDSSSGGCSGGDGSSNSSNSNCAVVRRPRGRRYSPLSRMVLLAAVLGFVARRGRRRRAGLGERDDQRARMR